MTRSQRYGIRSLKADFPDDTALESAQRFVLERSGYTSTPQIGYYKLTSNQGITYTIKDVTVDQ